MAAPGRRNAERAARHRRIRIVEDLALSEAPARERRPWRTVGASARREVRAVTVVIVAMIRAFGSVGWASTECEAEWEGGADDGSRAYFPRSTWRVFVVAEPPRHNLHTNG